MTERPDSPGAREGEGARLALVAGDAPAPRHGGLRATPKRSRDVLAGCSFTPCAEWDRLTHARDRLTQRHAERRAAVALEWERERDAWEQRRGRLIEDAPKNAAKEAADLCPRSPRARAKMHAEELARRLGVIRQLDEKYRAPHPPAPDLAPLSPAPYQGVGLRVTHDNRAELVAYLPSGVVEMTVVGPLALQACAFAWLGTLAAEPPAETAPGEVVSHNLYSRKHPLTLTP